MYAIIESGGKQYKVAKGDVIRVEKLRLEEPGQVIFDKVLLVAQEGVLTFGRPYLSNAQVVGNLVKQGKAKKILVFKYKPKVNYRKRYGHRQPFTAVKIEKIQA